MARLLARCESNRAIKYKKPTLEARAEDILLLGSNLGGRQRTGTLGARLRIKLRR
jgi:hypothetical protein